MKGMEEMRSDFLEVRNKVRIEDVAAALLGKPSPGGFYRFPGEKSASIKIYPKTNSFCDYGRYCGGDCVALFAHIKGVSQWQALQEIKRLYDLENEPDRATSTRQTRSDIAKFAMQQRQQQEEAARQQAFRKALNAEVASLRIRLTLYTEALERRENQPFSNVWCLLVKARQTVEYKLDILCAAAQSSYRKLKRDSADYKEWRADCEAILREAGRLPIEAG